MQQLALASQKDSRAFSPSDFAGKGVGSSAIGGFAFSIGLAFAFIRFSWLQEVQTQLFGFNLGLLYIFGIPTAFGIVVSGGILRTLRARTAKYWMGFGCWLIVATAFSSWVGGSATILNAYVRTNLIMLFVFPGLAISWRDCERTMYVLTGAALLSILYATRFSVGTRRLELAFGALRNSNDIAAHLLLMIAFLCWFALRTSSILTRLVALPVVVWGLIMVLRTGSRGALLGLAVMVITALVLGTVRQKLGVLLFLLIGAVLGAGAIGGETWGRLLTFSNDGNAEAAESARIRRYLLDKTIEYTLSHPLTGVGPGQFADFEGSHETLVGGVRGTYHNGHNSFTIASSECGLLGFILFTGGVLSTFGLLLRTRRKARLANDKRVQDVTYFLVIGYAGFCVAAFFLNFTYIFYFPAMAGLAIAISNAAERQNTERATPGRPYLYVSSKWIKDGNNGLGNVTIG